MWRVQEKATKMMQSKEAISVYNPSNAVERASQECFHEVYGEWMLACDCQLFALALSSLKAFHDEWLDDARLLKHRIGYFFAPHMIRNKDVVVFVTHLLYLRDIVENEEIDGFVHYPVSFITTPLSYYLFREYPIHIHVNLSKLKAINSSKFIDLGGVIVSTKSVHITKDVIVKIIDRTDEKEMILKAAAKERERGVFIMGEEDRNIRPGLEVWDKRDLMSGVINKTEPGETGMIEVEEENGNIVIIPKIDFDSRFSERVKI